MRKSACALFFESVAQNPDGKYQRYDWPPRYGDVHLKQFVGNSYYPENEK